MDERIKVYDNKMRKTYEHLESDYQGIRAGRANPDRKSTRLNSSHS